MKTLSAIKYFGALAMSLVMGFALVGCDDDKSEIKPSEPLENEFDRVECTIDIIPASDMRAFADMSGASYTNFSGEDVALGVAMGNACDALKEVADYITTGVDEDGIARALEYFELI